MADEQEVPSTKPEENSDRSKHLQIDANGKDFWKKWGQPDKFHFMLQVGSDGGFATRVIEDLLADKFGGESDSGVGLSPNSPQENNVTGELDHTGDVATKVHVEGEAENPPTETV